MNWAARVDEHAAPVHPESFLVSAQGLEQVTQVVDRGRVFRLQLQYELVVVRRRVGVAGLCVQSRRRQVSLAIGQAVTQCMRSCYGGLCLQHPSRVRVVDRQSAVGRREHRVDGDGSLEQGNGFVGIALPHSLQGLRIQFECVQRARCDVGQRPAPTQAQQGLAQVAPEEAGQPLDGIQHIPVALCRLADAHHGFARAGFYDLRRHQVAFTDGGDRPADDRRIALSPGHFQCSLRIEPCSVRHLHTLEYGSQLGVVRDADVR